MKNTKFHRGLTTTLGVAVTISLATVGTTSFALSAQAAAAPAAALFGPDGTHYPTNTPDLRISSSGYHVVNVAASSTAIRAALNALTTAQIDQGTIIRVAPGNIPNMAALDGYSNTRTNKVLITARDGFESVTGGAWRFTNVRGISVMRFDLEEVDVKGAKHSSFGWLRLSAHWIGTAGTPAAPVDDVEFIEVVEPESVVRSSDSAQIKAYSPNVTKGVVMEGSYIAPTFYVDGQYGGTNPDRPHTDSLQIEGDGIQAPGVIIRDTAVFASNNSAMIIGGVPNVTFDHVLVVAGGVQTARYPFMKGGAGYAGGIQGPGSNSAIQGTGGGNVTAKDSIFIGAISPNWASVASTRTNISGKKATSGSFTYDASLNSWKAADINAVSVYPKVDYLRSIWNGTGTGTPTPTPTTPPTTTPTPTTPPTTTPTPKPTTTPDSTAPKVSATTVTTSGTVATLKATATDAKGVVSLTFYSGTTVLGKATVQTSGAFALSVDTKKYSKGSYSVVAKALDAAGNLGTGASTTFVLK